MKQRILCYALWGILVGNSGHAETFVAPVEGPIRYSAVPSPPDPKDRRKLAPFREDDPATWYSVVWSGAYEDNAVSPDRGEGSGGHPGVDIRGASGRRDIRAIGEGFVIKADNVGAWGNFVVVRHDQVAGYDSVFSIYAHLNSFSERIARNTEDTVFVRRDESIGIMGTSGNVDLHLHFQVDRTWNRAKPSPFWAVLDGRAYPRWDGTLTAAQRGKYTQQVYDNTINPMRLVEGGEYVPLYHKERGRGTVYRLQDDRLWPVLSEAVLFALTGLPRDFAMVEEHEPGGLDRYPRAGTIGAVGSLYKNEGEQDVWMITPVTDRAEGVGRLERRHVSSAAFVAAGLKQENVLTLKLDRYFLKSYGEGPVLWPENLGVLIGVKADGSRDVEGAFRAKHGEFAEKLGYPFDNGGGVAVHEVVEGIPIQDFRQLDATKSRFGTDGETALIYNPSMGSAFLVREGMWQWYKGTFSPNVAENTLHRGVRELGAPRSDELTRPGDSVRRFQEFEYGDLEWDGAQVVKRGTGYVIALDPTGTWRLGDTEPGSGVGGEEPGEEGTQEPTEEPQDPRPAQNLRITQIGVPGSPIQLAPGESTRTLYILASVEGMTDPHYRIRFEINGEHQLQQDGEQNAGLQATLGPGDYDVKVVVHSWQDSVSAEAKFTIRAQLSDWGVDTMRITTIDNDDQYIYVGGGEIDRGYIRRVDRVAPLNGVEWDKGWAVYRIRAETPWGVLAATWRGLRVSSDRGESWTEIFREGEPVYDVVVGASRWDEVPRILVGGAGGTYYGKWTRNSPFSASNIGGIVLESHVLMKLRHSNGDDIVIGAGARGVNGRRFMNGNTGMSSPGETYGRLEVGPGVYQLYSPDGVVVLAAIEGGGGEGAGGGRNVWRGDSYGTDWGYASGGLEAGDDVVGFFGDGRLYAYSRRGRIYGSDDDGLTWQKEDAISQAMPEIRSDLEQYVTTALLVDDYIIFGTTKGIRVATRAILRADEVPTAAIGGVESAGDEDSLRVVFRTTGPGELELVFVVDGQEVGRRDGVPETEAGEVDMVVVRRPVGYGVMPASVTAVSGLNRLSGQGWGLTANLAPRLTALRVVEPAAERVEVVLGDTLDVELAVEATAAVQKMERRFRVPRFVEVAPVPDNLTRFRLRIAPPLDVQREALEYKTVVVENGRVVREE